MKTFALCALLSLACFGVALAETPAPTMILSTTTSTQATGLLDVLLPAFTKATGIEVKAIAVGTGKAIEMARNGEADAVMVHARRIEDKFVADGFGVHAWDLMFNDFILVGPKDDPAKVKESKSASEAFKKIAAGNVKFASRGDKSGTQEKELELWQLSGVKMTGPNYLEVGQGMTETLKIAGESQAYTFCDRATWIFMAKKIPDLVTVYENPEEMKNPYGVMAVSNTKAPKAKTDLGIKLVDWLVSKDGQAIISDFKIEGQTLFHLSVKERK